MKIPRNPSTDWYVVSVPATPMPGKPYGGWRPCVEWCVKKWPESETVSTRSEEWSYHHFDKLPYGGRHWQFVGDGVFEFRKQEDLLIFLLRWS